jgi:hypothetical protein
MLNKKAQFYIFTAILLLTYAFAISRPTVAPKQPISSFQSLYKNFLYESPIVVNNALHESGNVSDAYRQFVDDFISFAKTKDPNLRMAYLLVDNGKLVIGNRLKSAINVSENQNSYTVSSNQELTIDKPASVELLVNDIAYTFSFDESDIQVKALFRKEDQNEVRIYVYE